MIYMGMNQFRMNFLLICVFLLISITASCSQTTAIQDTVICGASLPTETIQLPKPSLSRLSNLLYINECGGHYKNLVVWNKGEEFPSLGIGHFIWYPAGYNGIFTETFPELIRYLQSKNIQMSLWLAVTKDSPWQSRKSFLKQRNTQKTEQLRALLFRTINEQASFIVERLNNSLPNMLCTANPAMHGKIRHNFYTVAKAPDGLYALLDYINFKGEGISPTERYNGQGWGLLQVLQEMKPVYVPNQQAVFEFAQAGMRILELRIQNSPKKRNEMRWLSGWKKRLNTYYQQRY